MVRDHNGLMSLLLVLAVAGQISPIGTWRYNLATVRLVPSAQVEKQLKDPAHGKEVRTKIDKMIGGLKTQLKPLRLVFKADKSFQAILVGNPNPKLGTWFIKGKSVSVVMIDTRQSTPKMEITA